MHSLLVRQLRKQFGSIDAVPVELASFVRAVDEAYVQSDQDRGMLERSLDLSSRELFEANRELRAAARHMHTIVEAAGEGICELDQQGCVTFVNSAAARLLGWDAAELQGRSIHPIVHCARADGSPFPAADCPIAATFRDGVEHQELADVFWHRDGTSFRTEYLATPIRNERDEVTGAVIVFRNIERRLRLETQLAHARKLEAIGQLSAGIAHEINTPIQYITDNVQFLSEMVGVFTGLAERFDALCVKGMHVPEVAALAQEIAQAAAAQDAPYLREEAPRAIAESLEGLARVTKIVRAMKEFSHPGSDTKTPTDLNAAIRNTVIVTANEWKYVANVTTSLDEDLPLVPCFPGDLNQALLNLIVNAAQALGETGAGEDLPKGSIELATKVDGRAGVLITVCDDGPGISKDNLSRVFDPFFTTKPPGKGTGQGLAITHSIVVEKHGGLIEVESSPGKGTCFTVRLPFPA